MKIETIEVGILDTNCYLVIDEESHEALIIDPGDNAELILKEIRKHQLKPIAIVITHGHFDHMGGNLILKEKLGLPIMMNENDLFGLITTDSPRPDQFLKEGDKLKAGSLTFKIIHNPGHSPGGISLYEKNEGVIFTGDTLFCGTYGRVDLPHSSEGAMATSLKKLLQLPPETKVFPGHGRPTTIGDEQGLLEEF